MTNLWFIPLDNKSRLLSLNMAVIWLVPLYMATVSHAQINPLISSTQYSDKRVDVTDKTAMASVCKCMESCIADPLCSGISFNEYSEGGGLCRIASDIYPFSTAIVNQQGATAYQLNVPSPPTNVRIGEKLDGFDVKVVVAWDAPYYPNWASPNTYNIKFIGVFGNSTPYEVNETALTSTVPSQPGSTVVVQISAYNHIGQSDFVEVNVTTSSRVPGIPSSFAADFTPTGVNLSWGPPLEKRGKILNYKLRAYCGWMVWSGDQFEEYITPDGNTFTHTFVTEGCSKCKFSVQAMTKDGYGQDAQAHGETPDDNGPQVVLTDELPDEIFRPIMLVGEAAFKAYFETECTNSLSQVPAAGKTASASPINTPCMRSQLQSLLVSPGIILPAVYQPSEEPKWLQDDSPVVRHNNKPKLFYLTQYSTMKAYMICYTKSCNPIEPNDLNSDKRFACVVS